MACTAWRINYFSRSTKTGNPPVGHLATGIPRRPKTLVMSPLLHLRPLQGDLRGVSLASNNRWSRGPNSSGLPPQQTSVLFFGLGCAAAIFLRRCCRRLPEHSKPTVDYVACSQFWTHHHLMTGGDIMPGADETNGTETNLLARAWNAPKLRLTGRVRRLQAGVFPR